MIKFECNLCDEIPCIILVPSETDNDLKQECLFKGAEKAEFKILEQPLKEE